MLNKMVAILNKDFLEVEFTGKTKEGIIFDSNIKKDLEKINPKANPKPFVFSVGEKMFLEGIDDFLLEKEIGKEYEIELAPEKAFGKRNPALIKLIPLKIFHEKQVNPQKGMVFDFDGQLAKIISLSGGRVLTDFNNPLAGKAVVYNLKVLRKVEDINEKIKAMIDFFLRKDLEFKIEDKNLVVYAEEGLGNFLMLFKDKFKEILGLDLVIEEKKEKHLPKAQ